MSVDLSEFRAAYVVEAQELLTLANRHLLALEASLRRSEANPRAVRELFRAVHTIKGLSAMVGIEPIVAIAHRLEASLRSADRGAVRLELPAVDTMLRGVREIEQRLRAVAQERAVAEPSPELIDLLDGLDEAAAPVSAFAPSGVALDPALAAKLTEAERAQLVAEVAAGRRAVQVEFAPTPARAAAGVNITSVRERLSTIADLVKVVPRSTPIGPATPGGLSFSLLLVTGASDEEIAAAARIELASVRSLGSAPPGGAAASRPSSLPPPPNDEDEDREGAAPRGYVRVDVQRLDDAMEGLSSLIITRYRLSRAAERLAAAGANVRELAEILADNARQLRDLRGAILRIRMVPTAEVLERVPLLVRGLARTTGKSVRLELDVGDTELDKTVAERIFPALVHLVRNAVDHAIEPPAERLRAGKPEQGRLRIVCAERSNTQLELVVEDDGRGVDAAAVARRAGRELPRSSAELLELLCTPGLSTREEATTTSGRGMGMDIVKRTIVDQLGGELLLDTRPGEGTRIVLRVPLTISIVDAFTFESAGERFCVPVATVEEILEVAWERVVRTPGSDDASSVSLGMLERRGEALPLIALSRVIGRGATQAHKAFVVRRNGEPLAFAVEKLLGQQEVVVRPLEDPLVRVRGITGATDLGDGRPTLVLDLHGLYGRLGEQPHEVAA